jgi:hypothetical protein
MERGGAAGTGKEGQETLYRSNVQCCRGGEVPLDFQ